MSWWELQRVAVVVGVLAILGAGFALGGSALFGGWTRSSVTLWLFLTAFPMILLAGGTSRAVPFGTNRLQNDWNESMANDHLARRMDANRAVETVQAVQLSWTTAIALAGVVLLLAAAVVTLA